MFLTYVPKSKIMVHMSSFEPSLPYNTLPFLPPSLEKIETIAILKQESRAHAAISELKGIANIIPNQAILINAIVLQEAKDSSEIENIITTNDDLYKAASMTASKIDSATKEVLFYREALYEGYKKIQKKNMLAISDIIEIQKIIIQNDAGIRRTKGTTLFNDKTNTVVFTPPDDINIIYKLLDNFVNYLNSSETSLITLAVLHYQFETIHPFYDGNGRTGRIINILYLILKEYLDIPILYLSSYIIRNKKKYYDLLLSVTENNDWESWILYILNGIEITAIQTIDKVKKIKVLLDNTIETVKSQAPKIYSKELVETLFTNPYCKIDFIVKAISVERKAASRYLLQLEVLGILQSYKIGKENIFVNTKLVELLKI